MTIPALSAAATRRSGIGFPGFCLHCLTVVAARCGYAWSIVPTPNNVARRRSQREQLAVLQSLYLRRLLLNSERMELIAQRRRAAAQHKAVSGVDARLSAITTELIALEGTTC